MSLTLLRRTPLANLAPATGFTVFVDQYDTDARRPYRSAVQAPDNTGANAPFELAIGALVPGAAFCVGGTQRQVKYAGDGKVSTRDVPNAPACASSLGGLVLTTTHCTTLYSNDAALTATWVGGAGPLRVRCTLLAPSTASAPDYYAEQVLPAGSTSVRFLPLSLATAPAPTLASDDVRYRRQLTPTPPAGLAPGRYRVEVLEETGGALAGELTLRPSRYADTLDLFIRQDVAGAYDGVSYTGPDRYESLVNGPLTVWTRSATAFGNVAPSLLRLYVQTDLARYQLLSCRITRQGDTSARVQATFYETSTGAVLAGEVTYANAPLVVAVAKTSAYVLPIGAAAAEAGGLGTVYSNGQGGVSAVAGVPNVPRLLLANAVYFHPARPADATGGVVVEVDTHAARTPAAVTFELRSAAGAVLATNTTGRFGRLAAGTYTVRATLGPATLDVPVTLRARYGLKWRLAFQDVRVNKACRLELWARGYSGPVLALTGQGEPVSLETEGFAGGNTQPDLPAVIGSSATLRLRTAPGALAELLVDDRAGRADVYYDEQLVFTGYLQPDIYEEAEAGPTVAVELTATDGLAALRDVDFAGHVGQPLRGRWPVLHTLLHCLSRTDLALPLALFTNRRALEMSSDEQPETDLFTNRLAYAEPGKPLDLRAVLDALAQQQGGTLVQRNGRWELRAALEAAGGPVTPLVGVPDMAADAPGTVYPAGTLRTATVAGATTPQLFRRVVTGPAPAPPTIAGDANWRFLPTVATVAGRTYDAAGDHAGTETTPAPAARLTPERVAKPDQGPANPLYWAEANQHRQRRAGWRFLTATGDAAYATNAFRQGECFSDPAAWDNSGTALLPTAGWQPGERGPLPAPAFPLRLVEAGGESEELATSWPGASGPTDARYLESELAPLADGAEGFPVEISVSAKFYLGRELSLADDVVQLIEARLWVELVGATEGSILLRTAGAVLRFPVVRNLSDAFTTAKARLLLPVLPGTGAVRVRLHAYTYYSPLRARENEAPTAFLLQSVALQVQPQGARWKAADAYFASGAGGSVRPAGLDVFHVDAPARAGLFGGVAHAFRRSVTRGPEGNPATQWARADDLQPAPLLASAVLDALALRANPSQVLAGVVHHTRRPPEILDAIDLPYSAPGRRFAVGARRWQLKTGSTEVSLVEIGEGEYLVLPTLPPRVRLLHGLAGGRVRVRLRHLTGIRAIHP